MHITLLIATLAALLSGPLLYAWARPRPAVLAFLDGFLFVSIFGLVLLEAVPGTFSAGGWWSAAFLAAGLLGPSLLERRIARARREAHLAALLLAMLGLVAHSLGDGVALSAGEAAPAAFALPLAVALHSVPVGLLVWWLLFPVFGAGPPLLAIAGMCAGTVVGYAFGPALGVALGATAWAWAQALIAGTILHVVFGRPHIDPDATQQPAPRLEGLGNLCAIVGLVTLAQLDDEALPAVGVFALALHLALLAAPGLLALYGLAGLSAAGGGARAAWRRSAGWVDASAAWLLLALAAAALLASQLGISAPPGTAGPGRITALSLLLALYAAALLRSGGRAWIARIFLQRPGQHPHAH